MSRRRSGGRGGMPARLSKWLGFVILGTLAAAVAYPVINKGFDLSRLPGLSSFLKTTTTTTVQVVAPTSTETFLFGVIVEKADRDRLFNMVVPGGKVDEVPEPKNWRVANLQGKATLHIETSKDDSRGFFLTDGGNWNVALRNGDGQPYTDPEFLGMDGEKTAFVLATKSGRFLLRIDRSGSIRELFNLPENSNVVGFGGGAIWVATFTPGEGIESDPVGPSMLERISFNGTRTDMVQETRVIDMVIPDSNERYAYRNDDGTMVARDGEARWSGDGTILDWANGRLLIAQGKNVFALTVKDSKLELLGSLPLAPNVAQLAE